MEMTEQIQLYRLMNSKVKINTKLLINIEKYNNYESPETEITQCKINNKIFNLPDVTTKTIGIYAWLASNAMYGYDHRLKVNNLSNELLLDIFGIKSTAKAKEDISNSLDYLIGYGLITLTKTIKHNREQYFDIELPPINDKTFTKLNNNSINDITAKSKGTITLTRLGIYAAIKSKMFNGKVLNYGFEIMLKQSHTKQRTYQRNVNWLIDNNILSCFVGTKRSDNPDHIGRKKRYLAEMTDCIELTNIMIDLLFEDKLTWVDKDFQSAKADPEPNHNKFKRENEQDFDKEMKVQIEMQRNFWRRKDMEKTDQQAPTLQCYQPMADHTKKVKKTDTPVPYIRMEREPNVSLTLRTKRAIEA